MLHFCVCPKLVRCSCICRGLKARLHILSPILDFLWCELFYDFPFFIACSLWGLGFSWLWVFLHLAYSFTHSVVLLPFPVIPLYHFYCDVIWPKPARPLWVYCLFFFQWLNMVIGFILMLFWAFLLHCLWASLSHLSPLRHPWPICFPLASLTLFLILCSHGLLLTLLGFSGSITSSFILGTHGLSINPLLPLYALLWACCSPFSLFYITYCPWVCYFFLRAPLDPFASSRPSCLFYGPIIHYSYH